MNAEFAKAKLVKRYLYTGNSEEEYKKAENKFIKEIDTTGETYLSAYVEVEDNGTVKLQCFIECKNANSKINNDYVYGLFQGSETTKIEILRCGNNITNMSWMFAECSKLITIKFSDKINTDKVTNMSYMFADCRSLKELKISSFNTTNVINMEFMFADCRSLTNLDLSKFNTTNVTSMNRMFFNCSRLTELNLSKFNSNKVKYMISMFANCFQSKATLICTAGILKKINERQNSYLIIPNENDVEIKKTIANNNNQEKIYKCSVRGGNNPQIIAVKEYKLH